MSTKSLNSSADTDKYRLFKAEISDLKFFYRRIFGEDISDDEIIKKSSCNEFVILVLSNSKEEKIGISVLRYFDDCVSLWLFGIIPEARRKGIGQKLLEETEAFVLAGGFSKIRLSTYNIRKEMLSLAIKNDYKIYGVDKGHYGDGLKIRMNKTIHPVKCNSSKTQGNKKEVRFLLSVNCNYDCFFCHMEGLDSNFKYENNGDDFLAVLKNVITCGYNDVTFTGGEPANSKKLLLNAIDLCNSLTHPPALTIVTNGSLWNDTLIKAVSVYSGELKINFSAHSLDPQKYEKITQTSGCYDKAINNLRALIAAGIKVKLNCVILKSVNDSPEELIRYISYAHSLGVFSIKFLELLVTEEYAENFKYFTSADSIARTLSESGFSEDNKTLRARYFSNQDYPGLKIEVVQCTCKMGCGKCHTVRDRTFGPDAHYYPCFIQSKVGLIPDASADIATLFAKGDEKIRDYASKYGDDSPILISQDKFLKRREEIFFETGLSFDECLKILLDAGFKRVKIRTFKLFYCAPINPSDDWKEFRKILKFGYEGHTPNKIEFIFSEHRYQKNNRLLLSEQSFIDNCPPPSCDSLEKAKMVMAALDFEVFLEKEFELHVYSSGEFSLSLDKSSKRVNFKLTYSEMSENIVLTVVEQLKAVPIMIPFTKWLIALEKN